MSEDRHPLLICFDDSPEAEHAVREAGRLFPGASSVVVHVWRPLEATAAYRYSAAGVTGALQEQMDELDIGGREKAEEIAGRGAELARRAGLDAEPLGLETEDEIPDAVSDLAEQLDVTAIVMGSRGLGALQASMLGGFSNPVLHRAHRPVLIIPMRKVQQ
jgi:nucleotide-binding universal stress UspA family protein